MPLRATAFCISLAGAVLVLAVLLAARGPLPELAPVLILGALYALAEHQVALIRSDVSVSASPMLCMAAVVVFHDQAALLGPLLVGVFGGLYWPQIRSRDWRKILFNCGMCGLGAFAAALVFNLLAPANIQRPVSLLIITLPTAIVSSVVSLAALSVILRLLSGEGLPFRRVASSALQTYPFMLLGVFMGTLYLNYGAVLVPLFVVPILVARQTFASYLALKESQEAAVRTLIGALEAKDPYTAGHAERVARYAQYIGEELGMSPARLERLRFAALMHDVGKLVVPNHLLNKKGKLTAEEFAAVRLHEEVSVQILTRIDFLAPVAPSATSEAAEFAPVADDRGQPIEPHIVAVADAFDAMTSTRSYRRALPQQTAFDELRKNSGKQFHPRVVEALIIAIQQRNEEHGLGHEDVVHHA
ncbi:MAG: HD-GYP domain-containing protein, partial [Acidimicrobiia bacterium]